MLFSASLIFALRLDLLVAQILMFTFKKKKLISYSSIPQINSKLFPTTPQIPYTTASTYQHACTHSFSHEQTNSSYYISIWYLRTVCEGLESIENSDTFPTKTCLGFENSTQQKKKTVLCQILCVISTEWKSVLCCAMRERQTPLTHLHRVNINLLWHVNLLWR